MSKLKLGLYWAASCGGCDVSILDINEKILDVLQLADIVFWPIALDFKYSDVEEMENDYIDVCFFNGAVRNSEQEHLAHLLRNKSKIMIAYGSCASFGGIPGLANATTKSDLLNTVYRKTLTTENVNGIIPKPTSDVEEGNLMIPEFYNRVSALESIIKVDYYLPGCPPPTKLILTAIEAIATNNLPPLGSVLGSDRSLCDECPREKKDEKKVKRFFRPHEIIPEPDKCLLEQGIVCAGPATRGGCGAQCISVNIPCRGCFGPTPGVKDQGAKLLSAISSIIDSNEPDEILRIVMQIVDPMGTFYRFTLPVSILQGTKTDEKEIMV